MLRFKASRGLDPRREKPFSSSCRNTLEDDVPAVSANRCTMMRLVQQSAPDSGPPMASTIRLSANEELKRPTPYQRPKSGHCADRSICVIGSVGGIGTLR